MVGASARGAVKKLARLLSTKWRKDHSAVCGYLSARLSMALVKSTSMCLRNSRTYKSRPWRVDWGHGQLMDVF